MLFLDLFANPFSVVLYLIVIVIAITVHEFAHAYAADKLGDPTPGLQNRLTLDPRAHIDPWGMVFLIFFGFGWGRPVIYDPFNLEDPRKDGAKIAIAGPASNVIMAVCASILAYVITFTIGDGGLILSFLRLFILVNMFLALFNLIPVSPLDGFKIVGGILPRDKADEWFQLERYGYIFLLLLIIPFGGQSVAGSIVSTLIVPIASILMP